MPISTNFLPTPRPIVTIELQQRAEGGGWPIENADAYSHGIQHGDSLYVVKVRDLVAFMMWIQPIVQSAAKLAPGIPVGDMAIFNSLLVEIDKFVKIGQSFMVDPRDNIGK